MLNRQFQRSLDEHPFNNFNESVYDALYRSIINLSLLPGSALSETAIAEQMGVSRTPVRNALIRLQTVGLVVHNKGQAFQVAEIQKNACRELMEARLAVEGHCACLAAERATEEDLRELNRFMGAFLKAYRTWDIDNMVANDHQFHQSIVTASHNSILADLYARISPRVLHYRHYLFHRAEKQVLRPIMGSSLRHHQAACNAIKLGFPTIARECMEKDISGMPEIMSNW